MRLIDADAFKQTFCADCVASACENCEIVYRFKHFAPTVDPVKHGKWIGVNQTKFEKLFFHSRVFKCSICGNYLDFDGVNMGRGNANYCPNCGAKMDEVENVRESD